MTPKSFQSKHKSQHQHLTAHLTSEQPVTSSAKAAPKAKINIHS